MMSHRRRPDFLVIGGSRCGTTSLHAALVRHPALYVPAEKSPNYFSAPDVEAMPDSTAMRAMKGHAVTTEHEYLDLFAGAPQDAVAGEVSPVYLQSVHTAARAAALVPDARIVVMLRHPVKRAFAHWLGRRRDGLDPHESFDAAIAHELAAPTTPVIAFNRYLAIGRYAHFLRPWFDAYPSIRIHVAFFDDFVQDQHAVVNGICRFLSAPPIAGDVVMEQRNRGGIIRNPLLRTAWTGTALLRARMRQHLPPAVRDAAGRVFLRSLERPTIDDALATRLQDHFRTDLTALEALVGRDLSEWRQ